MRAVLQRVSSARVAIAGEIVGEIGPGLLVFLGIGQGDTGTEVRWLAEKIARLRLFEDEDEEMNRSVIELGEREVPPPTPIVLVVSQFTLLADTRKGTRPSFNDAAKPAVARPLYEDFVRQLGAILNRPVATGRFGATMQVSLVNDGPVTLVVETTTGEGGR